MGHGKMHKMLLESCNAMVRHLFPFRSKAKMHLGYEIQGAVSQKSSMSGHVHSIRVGFVLGTMSNNFDFSMTVLRGLLVQVKNRDIWRAKMAKEKRLQPENISPNIEVSLIVLSHPNANQNRQLKSRIEKFVSMLAVENSISHLPTDVKAIKLVWLHGFNVTVHARTIAQVQRDILVYVNFDTTSQAFDERLYSLALLRLTPVQAIWGLAGGTSGLGDSIDYFVTSGHPLWFGDKNMHTDVLNDQAPKQKMGKNIIDQTYSEQLVQLSSPNAGLGMGISLSFPRLPRDAQPRQPRRFEFEGKFFFAKKRYYLVLQDIQYIAPAFDTVLLGILRRDPDAHIILLDAMHRHLARQT